MRKVLALAVAGMVALASGSALADGDAKKGEKIFNKCKSCHMLDDGSKRKAGPTLLGVVGRAAGAAPNYDKYSKGYKAAAPNMGSWDDAGLMEYLMDPSKYLSAKVGEKVKSGMMFKLTKEKQRADVIAYLKTQM